MFSIHIPLLQKFLSLLHVTLTTTHCMAAPASIQSESEPASTIPAGTDAEAANLNTPQLTHAGEGNIGDVLEMPVPLHTTNLAFLGSSQNCRQGIFGG
ncbi:MAG: hypothetical protein FIA98_15305 [Anaerolineae bacterium]|nr:hypothetical protein [Anaerolineae bacterium]